MKKAPHNKAFKFWGLGKRPATFLVFYFILLVFCFSIYPHFAHAAALTDLSDTMSRLKISEGSDHTIKFTTPTGAGDTTDTITVTIPTGFSIGSVDFTDIDLSHGPSTGYETEEILAASASATEWGATFAGQVLTLTHPTNGANGDIAATEKVVVEIGLNASSGNQQITNHASTGVYTVTIGGTFGDDGEMDIIIIDDDQVQLDGSIAPSITFTISATSSSFGELSTGSIATSTPDITLTVGTNAGNGYLISVRNEGDTVNPGLYNNSASYLIGSTNATYDNTDTLVAGTEGYGIQSSSGDATIDARYDQTGNDVGGLEITDQNLATYTTTMASNHTVTVVHKVAIASFSASGNYADTLTYIATANY
ncbi:hypothetical protein ACFL24_01325 [Patescibacteria group bacterium]